MDVLCLTETWLKSNSDSRHYTLPGYALVHSPRGSRGGGVGAYVRADLRVRSLDHPSNILEQLWIEIRFNKVKVLIGVAYRPEAVSTNIAVDCINESLSVLAPQYEFIFIMGDLNINCLGPNNDVVTPMIFRQLIDSYYLHQVVDAPTRVTPTSQTLIDVIFTRKNITPLLLKILHNEDLSDHGLIISKFPIKVERPPPRSVSYRPLAANAVTIKEASVLTPWEFVLMCDNINDMVQTFNSLVLDLFDTFAPECTRTFKDPPTPWMTETLRQIRNMRDRACYKAKKRNCDSAYKFYRDLRNTYNRAVFSEKQTYFSQFVNKNKKILQLCGKI